MRGPGCSSGLIFAPGRSKFTPRCCGIISSQHLGRFNQEALPSRVRSWNAELARSHPVTAAKAYRLLKGILATAVTDELVGRNPCMVKGAAQERPMVSIAEVDALVTAIPERWRIAVELAAWCHRRLGEVLGLERRDIDLLHAAVRVSGRPTTSMAVVPGTSEDGCREASRVGAAAHPLRL